MHSSQTAPIGIVTIVTTAERARVIELSLRDHASGIRPWAQMPDEERARNSLAKVEAARSDVLAGINASALALAQADGDPGEAASS